MSLTALDIHHSYSDQTVLSGVSLSIVPGRSLAVMGPSGSGKTTLLAIVGLLMKPLAGLVQIDSKTAPSNSRGRDRVRARKIAWIFQTMNVVGERTTVDNVALALMVRGQSRDAARAEAIRTLAEFGLGERGRSPANSLSGGEVQRLCVARALASAAPYLLADEPTGNLDRTSTLGVVDALEYAQSHGVGLLVATHDHLVAERCDTILELVDGVLR